MARRYVRDAKGRFAPKGYSGQTGGRGARLKSGKGNVRSGGGKRENLIGAGGQTMTSVPKGTIGKTAKLRRRSTMDMTGQQFAKYEAGKKAARAEKSRAKQEAFFKKTQKGGREMSKAEFARKTGGKTRDDSMSAAIEMSRQPRGRTKAGDRRNEARLRKIQDEVRATDKAYNAAIKSGRIKSPTRRLADIASGNPDNASVQAARRLQAKTAAARAARQSATANKISASPRRLSKDQQIARDVMTDKRFRSDRQRRAEMIKRGVKADSDFVGLVAGVRAKQGGGTTSKIKPAARRRGDTASVNMSMRGSRGRRLDAEISRNVKQQQTTKRAESRARNAQFKSDQSRAKVLRGKYGDQLAKDFAAKSGRKVSEVKATIKGMAPAQQVKLLTKAGREQRAQANLARTADTRNQPGSTMIRRPSQKMTRGNLRAERALEFYKDPKQALKSVNKTRRGFRMPRSMR